MGKTKKASEMVMDLFDKKDGAIFTSVRFGNVFNSSGSAIELFIDQISTLRKITITNKEMTRYFMTIPEAVHLVMYAWYIAQKDKKYMLEMGDPVNIFELAKCIIILKNLTLKGIEILQIGSRPGEKVHEELYDSIDEKKEKTEHKRIYSLSMKNKQNYKRLDENLTILLNSLEDKNVQSHDKSSGEILHQKLTNLIGYET